jgi:CTP:molybdopterin cytidylyltransferase MocA
VNDDLGPTSGRIVHTAGQVVGLVLAGGLSRRLPGQHKQLLDLGGRPLVQHGIDLLRSHQAIDEVVVALGHQADEIRPHLDLTGCQEVVNSAPSNGCSGSITAAMSVLLARQPAPAGVVLIPGDQPLLHAATVTEVVARGLAGTADIVVTDYRDGTGHPFFFGPRSFDRLASAGGDKAAWKVVNDESFAVDRVAVADPQPRDIDTWDDYHELRARFEHEELSPS